MAKVRVGYKVVNRGYAAKYKTKTIAIDIPVSKYGFTLTLTLLDNIRVYFETQLKITNCTILNFQVVKA